MNEIFWIEIVYIRDEKKSRIFILQWGKCNCEQVKDICMAAIYNQRHQQYIIQNVMKLSLYTVAMVTCPAHVRELDRTG